MRRTHPIPREYFRVGRASAGLGLFAVTLIEPGMYIEYVGTIISTSKANKMTGARYLFEINNSWTINGSVRTNLARYINYSCDPNCESTQTGNRVFIKAIRYILPGEELTYDYGDEYVNQFIKPHGCKCLVCVPK